MTPGRRAKQFCNSTCRSKFWYGMNVKNKESVRVEIKDLTKPTNQLKPKTQPKTNYSINTASEQKNEPPAFKNEIERMFWEEKQKIKNKNQ